MDALDRTLSDLAVSFALPSLALGDSGVAKLAIGGLGDLYIERAGEYALLSLYREVEGEPHLRALEQCAPAGRHPWPVGAAMARDGKLGFFMRVPMSEFSLVVAERGIGHLDGLLRNIEGK